MKTLIFTLSFFIFSIYTLSAQLPANMYADSVHAPFYYGVSSGDPSDSSFIIWTHISPVHPDSFNMSLNWEVSESENFSNILYSGITNTDSLQDYTVKIDVTGLLSGSTYFYRFSDMNGNYSDYGRAKTLPLGALSSTKIAVMSCSSIFSGFFNAYRRLAEREDLQLIVHLGDYIYDFVDQDEQVRIPNPYPVDCATREDWIERHKYYLLDPDLREARRMQTWYAIWDNHDIDSDSVYAKEIFRRWMPIRETAEVQQNLLYRYLQIGDLADLSIFDVESLRNIDTFPSGEFHLMGHSQFEWATSLLKNSNSRWHLMGSQKMAGGWYTRGIDQGLLNLVPNDGDVFDNGSWDGFPETRKRLFDTIINHNINNCLLLSGDTHITMFMDLVKDPYDSIAYEPSSGIGAIGCEYLPSSISRGNFDEAGVPASLSPFFIGITMGANPHHLHMEINSHGYGLIEISEDSIVATPYYSDILSQTNIETAGQRMVMKNGVNHWERLPVSIHSLETLPEWSFYPNPANSGVFIRLPELNGQIATMLFFDNLGREIKKVKLSESAEISVQELSSGFYWLSLESGGKNLGVKKLQVR
jgi:alkaline phosphatase D